MEKLKNIFLSGLASLSLVLTAFVGVGINLAKADVLNNQDRVNLTDVANYGILKSDNPFHVANYDEINNHDYSSSENGKFGAKTALPSSYDTRLTHPTWISPVRNQGQFGTCWAHAVTALGYASGVRQNLKGIAPLSVKQLVYSVYNNAGNWGEKPTSGKTAMTSGGNAYQTSAAWANGYGPVLDSQFPYPTNMDTTVDSTPLTSFSQINQSKFDLTERQLLPVPNDHKGHLNLTNLNLIKQSVINNGAVYVAYNAGSSYEAQTANYNSATYGWYNSKTATADHAVTIVGYDDNYSASNFNTQAPGNGAFIVQNSWGSSWGKQGYFYLSYYDNTLDEIEELNLSSKLTNETIQSYDFSQGNGYLAYSGSKSTQFANQYTSPAKYSQLEKVSFSTQVPGTSGTVYIYASSDLKDYAKSLSGALVAKQNYNFNLTGYHQITLSRPVGLPASTKYTVVVKANVTSGEAKASAEYKNNNKFSLGAGQSFSYYEGHWLDMNKDSKWESEGYGNFDIRTYFVNGASASRNTIKVVNSGTPAFKDLKGHGSSDKAAIKWLYNYGITTGMKVGKKLYYQPSGSVTRLQMALFLYRLAGQPSVSGMVKSDSIFKDMKKHGSSDVNAVTWLVNQGVTTGTSGSTYSPNGLVTRQQMALFMWRLSGQAGSSSYSKFKDIKKLDSKSQTAIKWMAKQKVTTGTDPKGTKYAPTNLVSRVAMALFIQRLYNNVLKSKTAVINKVGVTNQVTNSSDENLLTLQKKS
ncbi:MAG: S-layer homology domain-containing protein [Candidatus Ancillula sp.]|nr:S-layer homology domain-containing protein [Candidatus Ancillula sp.]